MYLSVKRSQHALLALGFFLLMFLVIFSTILYVLSDQSHSRTIFLNLNPRYFAERGTWDPTLETFIDGEGEVSQFSVRRLFPSLNLPSNISYPDSPSQQQPGSSLSVRTPLLSPTHPLTDPLPRSDNNRRVRRNHAALLPRAPPHRAAPHLRPPPHRAPFLRPRPRVRAGLGGDEPWRGSGRRVNVNVNAAHPERFCC